MSIRIFVTGGTFDKEYNEITGKLYFRETHLPEMISRSRVTPEVNVRTLMMIDSLEMKPVDRDLIVNPRICYISSRSLSNNRSDVYSKIEVIIHTLNLNASKNNIDITSKFKSELVDKIIREYWPVPKSKA